METEGVRNTARWVTRRRAVRVAAPSRTVGLTSAQAGISGANVRPREKP